MSKTTAPASGADARHAPVAGGDVDVDGLLVLPLRTRRQRGGTPRPASRHA